MNTEHFVDVFQDMINHIVEIYDPIVGSALNQTGGEKPYAMYGSFKQVIRRLAEKDESNEFKFKKYPLIVLIQDLKEDHNKVTNGYKVRPRIIIFDESKQDYYPDDRMTNTVKPTLQPLYNLLLQELFENPYVNLGIPETIDHEKTNRLNWGTSNPSEDLEDFLDAIDIQFGDIVVHESMVENCILEANI